VYSVEGEHPIRSNETDKYRANKRIIIFFKCKQCF
jgi:hypothetical protein